MVPPAATIASLAADFAARHWSSGASDWRARKVK
jgi:hypothetical protein